MTTTARTVITEAGVYDGMSDDVYHSDPVPAGSLSSTGARRLLLPSCPALYRHDQLVGQPHKREFDIGHAAHYLALGAGPELAVIDADDWRTKAARADRDAAYAKGEVPVLAHEYDVVEEMATVLREHPVAGGLFDPAGGKPEQSLFWVDQPTGVWRRARLDWLPHPRDTGRLIIPDYKTCKSAEPAALSRAMENFGLYQQAPYYLDGVEALNLSPNGEAAFVFVFQMKTRPYLVTICQPDPMAMRYGRLRNRKALDVFAQCQATGTWPGYADTVISLPLPPWAERQHEAAFERGDYEPEMRKSA